MAPHVCGSNASHTPFICALSEEQHAATTASDMKPLLILAGPGCGKTRVLTSRIKYFIEDMGIDACKILAMTFSRKAVGEMRERLGDVADAVTIGTFHSVFYSILRPHANLLGFKNCMKIIDKDDSDRIVARVMKKHGLSTMLTLKIRAKIDEWRLEGLHPEDLSTEDMKSEVDKDAHLVYDLYRKYCKDANGIDFEDVLLFTHRLFKNHPEIMPKLHERWTHIFVDEYQDTNDVQLYLIKKLFCKSITVVGDDYQAIHEWRGARPSCIRNFESDFPGAQVRFLTTNYRSQSHIVTAAQHVIKNNVDQRHKDLTCVKVAGERITFVTVEKECKWLATTIQQHIQSGHKPKDIAILCRNGVQQFKSIEYALIAHLIPYHMKSMPMVTRHDIKVAMSYMRIMLHHFSDHDIKRILNVPPRGIGPVTMGKIYKIAQKKELSLLDAMVHCMNENLIGSAAKEGVAYVKQMFDIDWQSYDKMSDVFDVVLNRSQLIKYMKQHDDAYVQGIDLLSDLRSILCEQDQLYSHVPLIDRFVQFDDFMKCSEQEQDHDESGGRVSLITTHASKGLEYQTVFIPGMNKGVMPDSRSPIEAERRLFYVGMTRAKDKLYLVSSTESAPSCFVAEIPEHLVV